MNMAGRCSPALDSVCPERAGFDSDTLRRAGIKPHVLTVSSGQDCDAGQERPRPAWCLTGVRR